MDLTIKEITTLSISNNVNFYEQILFLLMNKLGTTRTMSQTQTEARTQSICLSDYELAKIENRT